MATTAPPWMLDARNYGFPSDELAGIHGEFPEVRIYFNANSQEYSVWAVGDSRELHPLMCLERAEFYTLHQQLRDMRYRALNRPLSSIIEYTAEQNAGRQESRDARLDRADPDRAAWSWMKDNDKRLALTAPEMPATGG